MSAEPGPTDPQPVSVLIVTLGGVSEPIVFSIRSHRPRMVWYVASRESAAGIPRILADLDPPPPQIETILLDDWQNLAACYGQLLKAIPALMDKHKVDPGGVVVDYTGGTKTMSAAVVLAAAEFSPRFSYVTGTQRENGPSGRVVSGTEYHVHAANPWHAFAVRAREHVAGLFALGEFEACAAQLERCAPRSSMPSTLESYAALLRGYAALDRFDKKGALSGIGTALRGLAAHWETSERPPTARAVRQLFERVKQWPDNAQEGARAVMVPELLGAARRRAATRHYDDACARLYRAMEMHCQARLDEMSDGRIRLGRAAVGDLADLELRRVQESISSARDEDEVRLGLEDCVRELAARGDDAAGRLAEDLKLGVKSEFRRATQARNNSILAHGSTPVSREDFERLWDIAGRLIGPAAADIPDLPDPGFFF